MTSYSLTVDQRLRNQGIRPEDNSAKYYEEVDNAMRREYPEFFGVQSETEVLEETQNKQPSNVVAPVTRATGGNTKPRNIRLTQTQVKLARQLGISPEQYAKQLLKES
jgi:phage I-like protein